MANVRYYSEFRTLKGDFYLLEIYDTSFTGDETRVYTDSSGFTLTHDGETDQVYSPIIGSSVQFNLYNQDSAFDTFLNDILTQQENRFYVKIYQSKKEATDDLDAWYNTTKVVEDGLVMFATPYEEMTKYYDFFWAGYIVQDLIEEIDESKPRLVSVRASDGISLLSTTDYEFTLASSEKTIKDILVDILTTSNVSDMFIADDILLTTISNFWANEHTYSATTDPTTLTRFDLKVFTSYNEDGTRAYTNALDVIREICLIFSARFYFDKSFRFEQLSIRDKATLREFRYVSDGSLYASESVSLDVNVDQENVYRSRGTFRHLPAVKKVSLIQQRVSSANLIGRSVVFPTDEIDVGVVPASDNGRVILNITTQIQTYISSAQQGTATPLFAATIRLEPTDGSATRYWKNSIIVNTLVFGPGSWSTTSDTLKFASNLVSRSASLKTKSVHTIATGPLPTDGELFIDIDFLGFYDFGLDPTFIASPNSYAWSAKLNTAQFENDNNPSNVVTSTFSASNTSTNVGSNITLEIGQTRLGDGAGALGSLYAFNGSAFVPSTAWRIGNSGTYVDIAKLSVQEILSLQSEVVKRFEGVTIQTHNFSDRLVFDSAYWIQMRGTFTANTDEYEGEWFKIARTTATTNLDPVEIDVDIDATGVNIFDHSGMYGNIGSGSVGNMPVSYDNEAIGPYQQTATGGQINGSAVVTGDTHLEAGLTHDGFLIENIKDVTHSSGSSYDVTDTDYMIFNTWSGTTGTATVNLPSAADNEGRLLRFKSDGTIAANKIVNLVPRSGDTIDGNGEFAFDRDYDGVMVLAHNDNWFIIQRKAK